jgi:hypothetical protein
MFIPKSASDFDSVFTSPLWSVMLMTQLFFFVQYFFLVVVIFLLEIVSSILAFVYRNEIETKVRRELLLGIQLNYIPGKIEEEGLVEGWKAVQSTVS